MATNISTRDDVTEFSQTLHIGEFIISVLPSGDIYIGSLNGEAGSFKADLFEETIRKFFWEHF